MQTQLCAFSITENVRNPAAHTHTPEFVVVVVIVVVDIFVLF